MYFCTLGRVPAHGTKISDLITHKDFRVILMMMGLKSFHITDQFKNKVDCGTPYIYPILR